VNTTFAEATTGIAFVLTLTKRQCNTLLRLAHIRAAASREKMDPWPRGGGSDNTSKWWDFYRDYIAMVPMDSLRGLRDRVLVFWHTDKKGEPCGFGGPTKAGDLMIEMLGEAGLTIENTNTLSVIRYVDRRTKQNDHAREREAARKPA
jgi:hypothetical protein